MRPLVKPRRPRSRPFESTYPGRHEKPAYSRSVAFSAGIGEEIFYRGFLLWYLPQFMPMIAALCVSSIFFGLAHAMHGLDAAIRSAFVGALLAGLYLLGGSLLAPMLLHTAIDLSSGETGMAANESDFEKRI